MRAWSTRTSEAPNGGGTVLDYYRTMEQIRSRSGASEEELASVAIPTSLSPDLQAAAVLLITRAEAMGLLPPDDLFAISGSALTAALNAFNSAGIGRQVVVRIDHVESDPRGALDLMNDIVEQSPHPETEWSAMTRLLTPEDLARWVGVSESSLRRYAHQVRLTPPAVAARLHWISMRVADLAGAYNRFGILRWFERPRRALGGDSPASRLAGSWGPDDPAVREVAALASSVLTMSAT